MAYQVRSLSQIRRSWRLQYRTFTDGKDTIRQIPESEYARLGFNPSMTIAEAKARAKSINAVEHDRRHEKRRNEIQKRLNLEERSQATYLNASDVAQFEEEVLFSRGVASATYLKLESHWRFVKRLLTTLKIEPRDWKRHKTKFYDAFSQAQLSPSYTKKLLHIMNQWGTFVARKQGYYFEPIPGAIGIEKERIADAYFEKAGQGRISDPITPRQLDALKLKIKPEWWNWFYLSVWFGLRPIEVDQLLKPEGPRTWTIGKEGKMKFLAVYQTKLVSVPRDKRTKKIPCLTDEQVTGLAIIKAGNFKRPSATRHLWVYFGENTTLYGGRKGFESLMSGLGQSFEHISMWMGHRNIQRTWESYTDKQELRFSPLKK